MKKTRPTEPLPARASGYWLLGAAVIVLLPHLERFPLWLTAVLAALFSWYFLLLRRAWPVPNRWLRLALTLLLAFLIFRQYGTLFGRDAGSALLAVMLALKFLELRRLRDYLLSVFLIYFLIVIGFLYSQALWLVLYLVGVFVVSTATLIRLAVPGSDTRYTLRLAGLLMLQALPLMLAMHILFPRIQGSLWGLPQDAYAGLTGLSDTMQPGSINQLSLSEAVAFRAQFTGNAPARAQLYWRALILWTSDGIHWTRAAEPRRSTAYQPIGPPLTYTVTLEASNKPWLPALDLPSRAPPDGRWRAGFVFEAAQPVRERLRYALVSHPRYRTGALTADERRAGLQLPERLSARLQQLAAAWRAEARDDAAVVAAALRHFRSEAFYYTLQPPLLGDDPMDEFLFEVRRGFCEHYAAAFVMLMRSAGVPARIVTGYQGGEFNPTGNYYIVRQSDAHAWAEVWLADAGWTRVDPTAAIAPERIEYGADGLRRLLARGALLGGLRADTVRGLLSLTWLEQARQQTRLSWDAVNTTWQRWVLDYGRDRQQELLARLGLRGATPYIMVGLLAAIVIILLIAYALSGRRRAPGHDPVRRAYLDFCRKLARVGVVRAASEGAAAFAERSATLLPQSAPLIHDISNLYIRLRYGELSEDGARQELKAQVARFRPTRRG